jgi:uncharacterized protein (TIGR00730 family)
VFGGATGGLMTRVSEAFASKMLRDGSQQLIGVVPEKIIKSGRKSDICTCLYQVQDMCERKRKMREVADCFVCLPGSYGTLDEMFDVIASGTVFEHAKKIAIFNYEGFYDGLKTLTAHMKHLQVLPQDEVYTPYFADTQDDLYAWLDEQEAKLKKKVITN